jgi:hypothetical protein
MSTLAIFSNFPTTKAEINICIKNAKEEILSGDFNPLEIDLHMKKMEEVVKGLREDKEIKAAVMTELEKYVEKTVKLAGCEITKKSLSSWDYDFCNDVELNRLSLQADELIKAVKERQAFLQSLPYEMTFVNNETGEIDIIYPAKKLSKDSFSIKIL